MVAARAASIRRLLTGQVLREDQGSRRLWLDLDG